MREWPIKNKLHDMQSNWDKLDVPRCFARHEHEKQVERILDRVKTEVNFYLNQVNKHLETRIKAIIREELK